MRHGNGSSGLLKIVHSLTVFTAVLSPAILSGSPSAWAQCDHELRTYHTNGAFFVGPGQPGWINSMVNYDDGTGPSLVVGGNLNLVGGAPVADVAQWRPGRGWSPMGSGIQGGLGTSISLVEGTLYLSKSLGLWRWDGATWLKAANTPSMSWVSGWQVAGSSAGALSDSIYAYKQNALFRSENGSSWTTVATADANIHAILIYDAGSGPRLFVAGAFSEIAGIPASGIAAWDGTAGAGGWNSLGLGIGGGPAHALSGHEYQGKPTLFVGGGFRLAGGQPAKHAAFWRDDEGWTALPPTPSPIQTSIRNFAVLNPGAGAEEILYIAASDMQPSSGDSNGRLYRLDGSSWIMMGSTWQSSPSVASFISTLHVHRMGDHSFLIVAGGFQRLGGVDVLGIARIDPPTQSIQPFFQESEALANHLNLPLQLKVFDDGHGPHLFAGGRFDYGILPQYTLVSRFDHESRQWSTIGAAPTGAVTALEVFDDGSAIGPALYAAGSFTSISGAPVNRIARWCGMADEWLALGDGLNGNVTALSVHNDGAGPALYVAGDFTTAGGVPADRIARWDGAAWSSLGGGIGGGFAQGSIQTLLSHDDGSGPALYVGGSFTSAGGKPIARVARWTTKHGWQPVGNVPGTHSSTTVTQLHVHDDGTGEPLLIAGGVFVTPPVLHSLLKWNPASQEWALFGDWQYSEFMGIGALHTFDDGDGPALFASCGKRSYRIARWKDGTWSRLTTPHNIILGGHTSMASLSDTLYIGGHPSIAEWAPSKATLAIHGQSPGGDFAPGTNVNLGVNVQQAGAVSYQWRHNGVAIGTSATVTGTITHQLSISAITGKHEGVYDVIISNGCETLFSQPMLVRAQGTCFGDITLDAQVNVVDLLTLINAWGACQSPSNCAADLAPFGGDGVVDVSDLLALVNAWGQCP